jgi:uncharacterized membrane protein (DUF4010 family)
MDGSKAAMGVCPAGQRGGAAHARVIIAMSRWSRRSDGGRAAPTRARHSREHPDLVSVAGLIVILMLIAAAITGILSHQQRVGITTWLVLLFVCGCYAGTYELLRGLVMPCSR